MKRMIIGPDYGWDMSKAETKVMLAALKVRMSIKDTSNYTPLCVRELKDAVDGLPKGYFAVEDA